MNDTGFFLLTIFISMICGAVMTNELVPLRVEQQCLTRNEFRVGTRLYVCSPKPGISTAS